MKALLFQEVGIMTEQNQSNRVNGIDLSVLKETVSAIENDPELGKCKFRARNRWIDANHNCTTITGYYGAKSLDPQFVVLHRRGCFRRARPTAGAQAPPAVSESKTWPSGASPDGAPMWEALSERR
jgi:hypothetical protein